MAYHELRTMGTANSRHSIQPSMWILVYATIKAEFLFFFIFSELKIVNFKFEVRPIDLCVLDWCSVNYAIPGSSAKIPSKCSQKCFEYFFLSFFLFFLLIISDKVTIRRLSRQSLWICILQITQNNIIWWLIS